MKVAIIITAKNESDNADTCLEDCQRQIDSLASDEKYSFSIFMNTQGSIGIESTWVHASKEQFEFYIFIDSSLSLIENAIAIFLENSEFLRHKAIIVGSVARKGERIFGGRTRRGRLIEPDPVIPVPCRLFDLNLVFIPAYAFSKVANPSDIFHRSILDYGYGERAAKADIARVLAPGILAETVMQAEVPDWKNYELSFWRRSSSFLVNIVKKIIMAVRASI
ncbi:MAG: hypothetical protein PUK70_04290 [Bacteroidales bacterium]|nr:hypothetical protein [Bacteroidales bacterium]MDY6001698.1 hypothetical protein [Candidatus Cryptobacteroides sp.]